MCRAAPGKPLGFGTRSCGTLLCSGPSPFGGVWLVLEDFGTIAATVSTSKDPTGTTFKAVADAVLSWRVK